MNDTPPIIPTTLWMALFPLTFLIHFAEEYWVGEGYPAYLMRLRGVYMSPTRFVALQMFSLALLILGCFIATKKNFPEFLILMYAGLVLCNGITHTITAIWDGGYGPGLLTSTLVWIPLGILTPIFMYGRLPNIRFAVATLIGFGIQGVVALLTIRGGKVV